MKQRRTRAIILRRTNYGEADRILQLLTPEFGVVSAIAKGVRREKSKLAGGLELFSTTQVTLLEGKGDLSLVASSRLEKFYRHIIGDYARLQFGYQAIREVARAAEAVADTAFFELLEQTFAALDDSEIDPRITEVWFWLQLAILLGVGLNLSTDGSGQKLRVEARYHFDEQAHEFREAENGAFAAEHIKLLRLLSAQPPKVAAQVRQIDGLLDTSLSVARRAVAH